ncbi:COG4626 Phage terminase-like protein, large subunit [uncultured Caudovirales phage]|uniref:COG4626 Phage terminase-like protein, large subunit n=1 Tax=uncultured Caudovirales phage TaxID=2100421 RepID=A0A6J5RW38_9CAUD|nr:COG4626 Phage terminase-like protein, large subunit [uncultured Caudovirales phage]
MEINAERVIMEGMGDVVAKFSEEWIVQTKGRWAGDLLKLEPWQRAFLDELFLQYDDGEQVYREALLGISRKNGKSTLSAAIALYMLLASGEQGPEVYVAAGSKDQARIVFNQAREFVDASPRLRDWLQPQRDVILCRANNGVLRVLSSDAGHQYGLNPSGVVIDELWVHQNPDLYYALTTGQLARENPLVVSITTAGFDRDSICYNLYERGKRLEDAGGLKAMREEAFLFKWYEAPPDATINDHGGWKAANPSSWIKAIDLQRESQRLPESVFRRLHLNQWTESEDAWIKPHEWDVCKGTPVFDPQQPSYMGVDVGIRRDSAAIIWAQWHGDALHIGELVLTPEEQGESFGVADVRGAIVNEAKRHQQIREIAFDPWSFRESAEILAESGLPMVEFPQNNSRMSPASENLYELVKEQRLVHDGNRVLRSHVLSAVVAPTDRGGWRISKRKSLERIDAAISLAMAADRAVTMRYAKPVRRSAAFL